MLKDWLRGGSADSASNDASTPNGVTGAGTDGSPSGAAAEAAQRQAHRQKLREQEPEIRRELSHEELAEQRRAAMRRKLASSAGSSAGRPRGVRVTYDDMFRGLSSAMMEGQETAEGINLSTNRQVAQNALVSSKFTLASPQSSAWECSLQSMGSVELSAATYSTQGRLTLMHQRQFKSGAMGVGQFAMMNTQMGPQGNCFLMLQVPWMRNGGAQLTYMKGQEVKVSHAAKVLRGTTAGASLTYDLTSKKTSMSWGAHMSRGAVDWYAQVTPDKGEWKVASTRRDWLTDSQFFVQLESALKKGGPPGSGAPEELQNAITFGLKKNFVGGAVLQASIAGFCKLKAALELPFGGAEDGMNRMTVKYNVQYDAMRGAAKQGLTISV